MASQFREKVEFAVQKKEQLFDKDKFLYAIRSMWAGVFLTMTTAAGALAADKINLIHPELGRFTFAFIFAWGLVFILFLNGELATSNMMFLTAGAIFKKIKWQKVLMILAYCTLFNLIGAILISLLFSQTSAFANLAENSFIVNGVKMRMARANDAVVYEAIITNIFVNIAILAFILIKESGTRAAITIVCVFMFVYLGQEHVIANFSAFMLVKFNDAAQYVAAFDWLNIFRQWFFAFGGNYIGGGILIGISYALLNRREDLHYLD